MRSRSTALTGSFIEEGKRLDHRGIRVVGRKHDAVYADLEQQVQKRRKKIEATESVVDIFA